MATAAVATEQIPAYALKPSADPAEREAERQAILDAAFDLLAASGYAGLKMHVLAGRLQLSMRRIYGHFSSKTHLMSALCERETEAAERRIARAVADCCDWNEKLDTWVYELPRPIDTGVRRDRTLLFAAAQMDVVRELGSVPGIGALPAGDILRDIIEQGAAEGAFVVTDVAAAYDAVVWLCCGTLHASLRAPERSGCDAIAVSRRTVRGMLTGPAAPEQDLRAEARTRRRTR